MSLSDGNVPFTMPIQPANSGGGLGSLLGGESIWIVVLFFIMIVFFGWGGNWGNNGNGGGGASPGYVLTSDFANIERKLDGINNGICDSVFALNNSIKDGFSAAEVARCNAQMAFMQQFNAVQAQIASCCCDTREAIQGVNYNLATQACDTRNLIQNSTRDIIEASNQNGRAILDFLVNSKMQDLQTENQSLKLAASQAAQNNYLVSALRPSPIPSYQVQNPYCCYQQCGCNGYN